MLSRDVRLLYDNARVHRAAVAMAAAKECDFEEISHPPHCTYLVPNRYYLFTNLKPHLRGQKCTESW